MPDDQVYIANSFILIAVEFLFSTFSRAPMQWVTARDNRADAAVLAAIA